MLAVIAGPDQREPVDTCPTCMARFGLENPTVADLPYPRGGGDLQPEITGDRENNEILLMAAAVDLGARVSNLTPNLTSILNTDKNGRVTNLNQN